MALGAQPRVRNAAVARRSSWVRAARGGAEMQAG